MIYSINEGQQAEEYKKRKQLEDHEKFMKEYDRIQNRSDAGAKGEPDEDGDILFRSDKDNKRYSKTKEIVDKELNRRQHSKGQQDKNTLNLAYHRNEARDALNRHMRRHPDQYKESFLLTEEDADEFLESIGVALYEDFVTIGEYSIPGVEAESILEEYGIFLYEEGVIIEGQQAEEYKSRKQAEKDRVDDQAVKRFKATSNPITHIKNSLYAGDGSRMSRDDDARIYVVDPGAKMTKDNPNYRDKNMRKSGKISDRDRSDKAHSLYFNKEGIDEEGKSYKYHSGGGGRESNYDFEYAIDSANRHIRRHPNQYKESCGIFSSIYFI